MGLVGLMPMRRHSRMHLMRTAKFTLPRITWEPFSKPTQNHGPHLDDPDYSFFLKCLRDTANDMGANCSDAALSKPVMYLIRKWQYHRRIFRNSSKERFWRKNRKGMMLRIQESSQNMSPSQFPMMWAPRVGLH